MYLRNLCLAACSGLLFLGACAPLNATDVTVLVNGSFDANPPWMNPGAPEYNAIMSTMGVTPMTFRWLDNSNVYPPFYSSIWNGGYAYSQFIYSLGLSAGDNLDVIAHSHGGNVVKIGSYYGGHTIRHLINLATPINYDLPAIASGATAHFCQASSFTDPVQFSGASPYQVGAYSYAQYYAGLYAYYASWDAYYGDWVDFASDSWAASYYQAAASAAWLSTKVDIYAATYMFYGGQSHSDMHEPPIWYSISSSCATN